MRVFNCDVCGHLVFFDSVQCVHCGSALAFVPDRMQMMAMVQADPGLWRPAAPSHTAAGLYKFCAHRAAPDHCNFALAADDGHSLCASCRQTQWIPDLSQPLNHQRWIKIEDAKRQLFYSLAQLGLGPRPGQAQPRFDLLADMPGAAPVVTGHAHGTITLNVAEADDDERLRNRLALHEPYRTLIGHLRHESGHFFWEPLIAQSGQLADFREMFGDERMDYQQALQAHYNADPFDTSWQELFISSYARSHPWEDWAETWAHYLHMVDLLETAASYGTRLNPPQGAQASVSQGLEAIADPFASLPSDFDAMLQQWVPLTLLLNSLNRSLGHHDAYPFTVSAGARRKLKFVHRVLQQQRSLHAGGA